MRSYLELLGTVRDFGDHIEGRNAPIRELFGVAQRYDNIGNHFPLLTTKRMAFKSIVAELLGFLRGYDDVKDFNKLGCRVWNGDAESPAWKSNPNYEKDYLGRIYGVQWRDWATCEYDDHGHVTGSASIDQITRLIDDLKNKKHSRRHIVTAWNPAELHEMCLPPCHMIFQCHVSSDDRLSIMMYQRSADLFLGVPFNIASYSLLILILCRLTRYRPGSFIHTIGSAHIYDAHLDAVEEQLTRLPGVPPIVTIKDRGQSCVEDFEVSDFQLEAYVPQAAIRAPLII